MKHATRQARLVMALGFAAGLGLVLWTRRRRARARRIAQRGPMTQATVPTETPDGIPGGDAEERLDEALRESFPASDPVSIHIE
jgi:hypothetical protein